MVQSLVDIKTTIPSVYHEVRTSPDEASMSRKELSDPVIDEIRAVRSRISARFDHDPERLIPYYIELQKRHADRLIGGTKDSAPMDEAAA
jgi:hypothetical protein